MGQYLIDKSKKLYNKVLPFIQFYIGYNDLFRILVPAYKFLNNYELKLYYNTIYEQFRQIDDIYILEQKFVSYKVKLFALSIKYKKDIRYNIIYRNKLLIYSGQKLLNISNSNKIIIWITLNIKDNEIQLEGKDNFWMPKSQYYYYCKFAKKTYFPNYNHYSGFDFYTMYGLSYKGRIVTFNIPIGENDAESIRFFMSYNGQDIEIFPSFGKFTHIPNIKKGYYSNGNYIIKPKKRRLIIYKFNRTLEKYFESKFCKKLKKLDKKIILILRKKYFQIRKKKNNNTNYNKEIWLINDKSDKAGDNGEYFFRFLKKKKLNNIKVYFVIKKSCNDYTRLQHLDGIIDLGSLNYLSLFLNSKKIISSSHDSWVTNPFGNDIIFIKDLLHFDVIFIPSGIIADDMSKYLNKIDNNFNLFITSSKNEYKSIISPKYFYTKKNVVITGLPKFDYLIEISKITKKEKFILIIPEFRTYLKGTLDLIKSESIYSDKFKNTIFFRFYNSLINADKILLNMKKYNFSGLFCLDPYFSGQIKDFTKNAFFEIKVDCNYKDILAKASLLVTDYNNIFFDFAYLKRPIIYSDFDIIDYRKNQFPKGYLNYKKFGFGPICHNIECLENEIIKELRSNCVIKNKYILKIVKFFSFLDNNNNERIYSAIINTFEKGTINFFNYKLILFYLIIFSCFLKIKNYFYKIY